MSLQFKDNTSTGVTIGPLQQDMEITLILITNKTGGPVTMNLVLYNQNKNLSISPLNLQLAAGTCYEDDHIKFLTGDELILTVNGSCDYIIDVEVSTD